MYNFFFLCTSNKHILIKPSFYVFYVNFKFFSLIILSPSFGFIVKSFEPGPLNMALRVAAYNETKTQACDNGKKEMVRIKLKHLTTYTVGELYLTRSRHITLYLFSFKANIIRIIIR